MLTNSKRNRFFLALLAAQATFSSAQTASASEEEGKSSAVRALTLEEVVVTATKKANGENIQDAKLSVVAFGEQQLDALNIQDISSLSFKIPNVALDDIGTVKGVANFSIRGLGTNSSIPSIDPTVGTFVDGVFLGVNFGVIFDTFDLASVETLRGPQGVLFGRNVTGGAVVLNTTDPTDEFTAKVKVGLESGLRGTGANYTTQGIVSGPIAEGLLTGKLSVYYNNDDGWFENIVPGATPGDSTREDFGESETTVVRGALKYTPSDNVSLLVKYEHGDQDGQGPAGQSHTNGSGVDGQIVNFSRNSFDFSIDERGFNRAEWDFVSAKLDIDVAFGDGTITNIFGYREFSQFARTDIDSTPAFLFHGDLNTTQDQISNELRYNGRFLDEKFELTAGLFYFEQDLLYGEARDLLGGALTQDGGGVLDQSTFGVFVSGEYQLTDAWSINAGLRWSDEQKDVEISSLALNVNAPCFVVPGDPRSTTACVPDFIDSFNTSNLSPKVGLGYEFSDSLRFYGHWARSFRAGGFNFRNTITAVPPGPFDDERIDSFEIGFKSEPVAGARLNAAVFFNFLDDLQRETNVPDGGAGVVQVISNTADAEIFGIEVDATIPVSENLVLTGGFGYLDGDYTEIFSDISGDGLIDGTDLGLEIPRLAPFTANFGLIYSWQMLGGDAIFNASYAYRDRSFFTDNNNGVLNSADRVDTDLTLELNEGRLAISLYGKNLTDDVQFGGDTQLPSLLGPVPLGGTFSPLSVGRQFGVEVQHNF
ncbi:TonB-dependent receptor [Porticoccus sp. GXU_MW_L64]